MFNTKYVDNFKEFYEEHKDFINKRYDEAGKLCNTTRPLNMNFELYQTMIDTNILTVLEVYDGDTFVGYCSLIISPAVLTKGKVDAKIDHLAFSEEYQRKGYASLLMEEIETLLRDQGADELCIVLPPTESHDKFAEAKGYTKTVVMHTKALGDK